VITDTLLAPTLIAPDAEGKFPTPLDGALYMASLGIPQIPLRPRTKIPFLTNFPALASTDFTQIRQWAAQYQGCNFGSVGRTKEYFVFEADTPDVRKRFEATGNLFTSKLIVASRPDNSRGHRWYKHAAGVTNIQQGFTKHGDFSVRAENMQSVSAGSIHPDTGEQYRLLAAGLPEVPSAAEIAFWESERLEKTDGKQEAPRNERGLVPHGSIHGFLLTNAGKLRNMGLDQATIEVALKKLVEDNCQPPIDWSKVEAMAKNICIYAPGEYKGLVLNQQPTASPAALQQDQNTILDPAVLIDDDVVEVAEIPPFDSTVMSGIMREYVELATVGTTLAPQFAFLATRVIVGALMTGKGIKFKDADTDAMLYGSVIGESGSGKGWAWRRVLAAFEQGARRVGTLDGFGCKIMDGIDSGAGLKDFFFTHPENKPIIAYIDEVADLGEKADPKRNPGIVTAIIELAENRSVSRTLAGKKKHTDKAYLGIYIAGQGGEIYMQSLPNRTRLGLFDRFRPEYSVPVNAGETPDIEMEKAADLFRRLHTQLSSISTMSMDDDAKDLFAMFWASQPAEIKPKVRYKKHVLVDAFMSAFSRGSNVVEEGDVGRAIRIFQRELVIRQVHFAKEVPNRMAVFTDKMIELTEKMRRQLNRGAHRTLVALGRSDFEKHCGSYKSGEYELFDRAFQILSRAKLDRITVEKGNGQKYEKYVPKPNDDGGALGW
jgi:hypothetical protein